MGEIFGRDFLEGFFQDLHDFSGKIEICRHEDH